MRNKILLTVLSLLALPAICSAATAVYPLPMTPGTTITGVGNYDSTGSRILVLGDVTGDQYPDFAYSESSYNMPRHIYIVKGTAAGLPPAFNSIDAWTPGKLPFVSVITEQTGSAQCGFFLAGGGDVDGDKINDIAFTCIDNGTKQRTYYLVNGDKNLPQIIKVSDIGTVVRGAKFTFPGPTDNVWDEYVNISDIDGDGKAELVLGFGLQRQLYVIKGGQTFAPGAIITLSEGYFTGANGFAVKVEAQSGYYFPYAVTLVDINGDGRKDIFVGQVTYQFGGDKDRMFLIAFGKETMPALVTLANSKVDGTNIARINCASMGPLDIQSIGDVNIDGYNDVAIANNSSYSDPEIDIIFGKSVWSATGDTVLFDGKDGSRINGLGFYYRLGLKPDAGRYIFATSAGDFNSDGIKDFIIGSQHYTWWSGTNSDAKIIMGQRLWPAKITLNAAYIDGTKAVRFSGTVGTGYSVGYIENIYGGIGCGLDSSYLIGSPRAVSNANGRIFIGNFKK